MESPAVPPVEPNLVNKPVPAATSQVTFRSRMRAARAPNGLKVQRRLASFLRTIIEKLRRLDPHERKSDGL
jgi:hypothetical protein